MTQSAFERETLHRLVNECARYWVISTFLESKQLPSGPIVLFAYADGPVSFDWGNEPGPYRPDIQVLRGKRIKITMEIEE